MLISDEVAAALVAGGAVVALETTLIAHGLPRPDNLAVARELEGIVRAEGAVPATIAVLDGRPCVGLDDEQLQRVANEDGMAKLSRRDLALAVATGGSGATTVASTAALAAAAGVRVFATGGIGGVHRGATETWDESADLVALSQTPIIVVAAGVKSILDVGATLERLESLNVGVAGYRTTSFPGFYLTDSGHALDWSLDSAEAVAAVLRSSDELGLGQEALLLANPLALADQLDPQEHDRVLADSLEHARRAGLRGKQVTPFLLDYFHRATDGRSLEVNKAVVRNNARLGARIAVAWSRLQGA